MKQLVCEMCGSTDLIKENGVFVCQSCGCKYSVEEAKKMMIEGTVDVSGSKVKVDNAERLKNLHQLADRAKEENDTENAAKYFEQILLEDPNDWEANFYTVFYAAHNIKLAEIGAAANKVSNCFGSVLRLIKDTISEPEAQRAAYMEIVIKVISFSELLVSNAYDHVLDVMMKAVIKGRGSDGIENLERKTGANWIAPAISMPVILGDKIRDIFDDEATALILYNKELEVARTVSMGEKVKKLVPIINSRIKASEKAADSKAKKAEEEKQARIKDYWAAHTEEKMALESEQKELETQKKNLAAEIAKIDAEIATFDPKRAVPSEIEDKKLKDQIGDLEFQRAELGIFAGKKKKQITEEIASLREKRDSLIPQIKEERSARQAESSEKVPPLEEKRAKLQAQLDDIIKQINSIVAKLTKDPRA